MASMTSVDERVDAQAVRMWRRDKRWGWFALLIPVQALACLVAYLTGRVDMGTAAIGFFALWVPTLIFYFIVRSLIWRRLGPLKTEHPENVAIALVDFIHVGKTNDSDTLQSFADFEKMTPAFKAWQREGMPELQPVVAELLVLVADKFPTWIYIGPDPDPEIYPLIYTALNRAYKTEAAEKLSTRFAKQFNQSLENIN